MWKLLNTLANAFKLANHILLKLMKYEGLVYNKEQETGEIDKIVDFTKKIGGTCNIQQSCRSALNKSNINYTYLGTSWKCGKFGYQLRNLTTPPQVWTNPVVYKINQ